MVSSRLRRLGGAAAVAVLLGTFAVAGPAQATSSNNSVKKLTKSVTLAGVLRHLVAFQAIASLNGGNRASGGPGYDRSADYVATLMHLAGYRVTRQSFPFNFCEDTGSSFAQNAPTPTTYVDQVDYDVMDCSGNGTATGLVVPVDLQLTTPNTSTSGCEAADFVGVAGNIALLQRGTCPFGQKVANAEAAGAIGAIVMNQGNTTGTDRQDLFFGTLGNPVGIPAVSVSYPQGVAFAGTAGLNVTITTETIAEVRNTENVIAESRYGDPDEVVMVGAHLDSEPDTAGINDNGSGSAGILEVALQMRKFKTKNKVRFAWWGAEESNLSGSTFYVGNAVGGGAGQDRALPQLRHDRLAQLHVRRLRRRRLGRRGLRSRPGRLGADRGGLPGVLRRPRRGDVTRPTSPAAPTTVRSSRPASASRPAASSPGPRCRRRRRTSRSGAASRAQQYDPCYHAPCDSLTPERDGADAALYAQLRAEYRLFGNVNTFAIDTNADAIATAVATFAYDTSSIPPRTPAPAAARMAAPAAAAQTAQGLLQG